MYIVVGSTQELCGIYVYSAIRKFFSIDTLVTLCKVDAIFFLVIAHRRRVLIKYIINFISNKKKTALVVRNVGLFIRRNKYIFATAAYAHHHLNHNHHLCVDDDVNGSTNMCVSDNLISMVARKAKFFFIILVRCYSFDNARLRMECGLGLGYRLFTCTCRLCFG